MAGSGIFVLAVRKVQVVGVRLYDCDRDSCVVSKPVEYEREPGNPYDANCVVVFLGHHKLGHVDRSSAAWLTRLLQGPFQISGTIASKPYSVGPGRNWSWKYRAVTASVVVRGPLELKSEVHYAVNGTRLVTTPVCSPMGGTTSSPVQLLSSFSSHSPSADLACSSGCSSSSTSLLTCVSFSSALCPSVSTPSFHTPVSIPSSVHPSLSSTLCSSPSASVSTSSPSQLTCISTSSVYRPCASSVCSSSCVSMSSMSCVSTCISCLSFPLSSSCVTTSAPSLPTHSVVSSVSSLPTPSVVSSVSSLPTPSVVSLSRCSPHSNYPNYNLEEVLDEPCGYTPPPTPASYPVHSLVLPRTPPPSVVSPSFSPPYNLERILDKLGGFTPPPTPANHPPVHTSVLPLPPPSSAVSPTFSPPYNIDSILDELCGFIPPPSSSSVSPPTSRGTLAQDCYLTPLPSVS